MATQFALCLFLTFAPAAPQSQVARDTPPPVIENARRERELRATIAAGAATKETYLDLALVLHKQGRFFDAAEAIRGFAALDPSIAEGHHRVAVYLWDAIRQSPNLDVASKRKYLLQAIEEEDVALGEQPDYAESLTYKNILLRMQAEIETDPLERKRLTDQADALRTRAIELQRQKSTSRAPGVPAPPPPPFNGFPEPFDQALARTQPARVGGNIPTPTKLRDVRPVYPLEAQSARIQGVVIIEALIDANGEVANARVVRSIPLLDNAAMSAVSQWTFTPTQINGQPVPVIMTVTVNFILQ